MRAERQGRDAGRRGVADRVDDLPALLELLPQLDVILKGQRGAEAWREVGMVFTAQAVDTYDTLEVTFNGQPIWTTKFEAKHLMCGDTLQLEGDAPGKIAAMIYEVIERGALLNAA